MAKASNWADDPEVPVLAERLRVLMGVRGWGFREMGKRTAARTHRGKSARLMAAAAKSAGERIRMLHSGRQGRCRRSLRDAIGRVLGAPGWWLSGGYYPKLNASLPANTLSFGEFPPRVVTETELIQIEWSERNRNRIERDWERDNGAPLPTYGTLLVEGDLGYLIDPAWWRLKLLDWAPEELGGADFFAGRAEGTKLLAEAFSKVLEPWRKGRARLSWPQVRALVTASTQTNPIGGDQSKAEE